MTGENKKPSAPFTRDKALENTLRYHSRLLSPSQAKAAHCLLTQADAVTGIIRPSLLTHSAIRIQRAFGAIKIKHSLIFNGFYYRVVFQPEAPR